VRVHLGLSRLSLLSLLLVVCAAPLSSGDGLLRVASFSADMTPQPGDPLIWTTPAQRTTDALLAKGVIIESGGQRYVLCSVDWCGMGNRTHALMRAGIARAATTTVDRVALHVVHQHTAPYVDSSAYDLLRAAGAGVPGFSDDALERLASRLATAVSGAAAKLQTVDRVGTSRVRVRRVASTRRLCNPDGSIQVRFSAGGKDPELRAAPEGDIDPYLLTLTFAQGARPLVRLHYYATHPQTFCCEGTVSADIVGAARERLEREEGVPQIYFTGAAGDVTVGKYNDGSVKAREELTGRLHDAMRKSGRVTRFVPVQEEAGWRTTPLRLPKSEETGAQPFTDSEVPDARYRRAIRQVFASREEPLEVQALRLGRAWVVHLPGEPMLEFQRYAQQVRKGSWVAVVGYGDMAPGYICTAAAYYEGGYEPGASNTAPGAEEAMKAAIRTVLGQ
jgi:hypothetical protein